MYRTREEIEGLFADGFSDVTTELLEVESQYSGFDEFWGIPPDMTWDAATYVDKIELTHSVAEPRDVLLAKGPQIYEAVAGGPLRKVKPFTPEEMSPICGIEPDVLRTVARTFARAENAIIFWCMGVSQHTHGTDNARCLIALSLICGQIGRPGTGLHPLRGQNNVQGASDAGLIPMFFPDYKSVESPEIRPNRINLDTGAYLTGRLTCLVLQRAERRMILTPIS